MEEKVGQSYRNTAEICYILSLLVDISKAINSVKSITNMTIAIITPYKAQVKKMKDELTNMIRRDYASNSLIRESLNMIEINTVDGFQGREVDIVIFSCVRTNDRIGFVSDDRRLNVALTRSKRCLIIVGNAHGYSLDRNANWSALLRSLNERQFVQKVKLPYESFFN
jgi:senataxin